MYEHRITWISARGRLPMSRCGDGEPGIGTQDSGAVQAVRRTVGGCSIRLRGGVAKSHGGATARPARCLHPVGRSSPDRYATLRNAAQSDTIDHGYDARALKGGYRAWHAIGGRTVALNTSTDGA